MLLIICLTHLLATWGSTEQPDNIRSYYTLYLEALMIVAKCSYYMMQYCVVCRMKKSIKLTNYLCKSMSDDR